MTLETQLLTMVAMILSGMYLGMALETYQRFCKWWQKNITLSYFIEISFWVSQTCILFYILYNVNNGELRIYTFMACVLGFSMYKLLLQAAYRYLLECIIKLIDVLLITPILWVSKVIYAILRSLSHAIIYLLKLIVKIIVFPLNMLLWLVKWLIPKKIYIKASQLTTFCSTMISNYKKSS